MEKRTEKFAASAKGMNIDLTDEMLQQFKTYYELLVDWNTRMNLTAITEYEDVVLKHFLDSLSLVRAGEKFANLHQELRLIDVGCGAGFPGIPLKIAFPNLRITLLDSLDKRIRFLNEVIGTLGLQHIEAVHGRAEDYAMMPEYREQFDLAVSRAVANLATLSEYCLPFVRKGGFFIPYKSETLDEELAAAKNAVFLLGGKYLESVYYCLPDSNIRRSLCIIEKRDNTAGKYPRKAGLPSKKPL